MRRFGPGLMMVLALALPVRAQVAGDPMELQRCVWRCLANSPGAASAAYQQCVADFCSAPGPATAAPVLPAPAWGVAPTGDGRGRLAGVTDPDMGTSLYVMCGGDGRRALVLVGPEGPSARLRLVIDTQTVAMDFVEQGGEYLAMLPPGSTVLAALWQAQVLGVYNAAGTRLLGVRMNGARAAIAAACP